MNKGLLQGHVGISKGWVKTGPGGTKKGDNRDMRIVRLVMDGFVRVGR
jgi:hypothetical protein